MFAVTPGTRDTADQLVRKYDSAAPLWARGLARLRYPEAYSVLAARGVAAVRSERMKTVMRVLDAGCGSGDFTRAVVDSASAPVVADLVDLSTAMLTRAEAALAGLAQTRTIHGAIEDVVRDHADRYDLVLCAHVLEHVEDPGHVLAGLREKLRPQGALLLVANRPH